MKKLIFITLAFLTGLQVTVSAQDKTAPEKYGHTLNLGAGLGYYRYIGRPLPVASVNFEFDVARNFTLAPFVGVYSYQNNYYWRDENLPYNSYRYYTYHVTVVPMGVKGTYYFDQLFRASSKWDFYAAGSLGFAYSHVVWEHGYYGDQHVYKTASPLFMDAHIGVEYHLNKRAGLFADLSTGVSTVGVGIHF